MSYMARWIVPSYYAFIIREGLEEPVIVKVREFLEAVVYLNAHRDLKIVKILINSKVATKLGEIAIFLHACLVLGIGDTQGIIFDGTPCWSYSQKDCCSWHFNFLLLKSSKFPL